MIHCVTTEGIWKQCRECVEKWLVLTKRRRRWHGQPWCSGEGRRWEGEGEAWDCRSWSSSCCCSVCGRWGGLAGAWWKRTHTHKTLMLCEEAKTTQIGKKTSLRYICECAGSGVMGLKCSSCFEFWLMINFSHGAENHPQCLQMLSQLL